NTSYPNRVVHDTTPPDGSTTSIQIDEITSDGILNKIESEAKVTITGTVKGEFTVGDTIKIFVNGRELEGKVEANGQFTFEVEGSDLLADSDKKVEITVEATDQNGNTGKISASKEYGVDVDVPGVPVVVLAEDTGNATDGITSNGTINVSNITENNQWEYSLDSGKTWNIGVGDSFILPDGTYPEGSVLVRQKDPAGNISESGKLPSVTIDTIAPTLNVTVSEDGTTLMGKSEPGVTVLLTYEDGQTYSFTVNDTGEFNITLTPALTDGEKVTVVAQDQAGNTSAAKDVIGGQDTLAPDAPDAKVDINSVLTVKTEPNATVKVYDKAGDVIFTGTADENGNLTHTFNPALERGTELKVTATDEAGNESDPANIKVGVNEIFATTDNYVDLVLNAKPKEIVNEDPSSSNKTGFSVASVGLGPVLGLDVLADVMKNSVQFEVGKDQVREITMHGDAGGIQVGGIMDLHLYKLNESTGLWEQHAVKKSWVISYLLGGKSKDTDFTLTEGKWMFVMASAGGVQALTGYTLRFTKDVILDDGDAESISGSASGNMMIDDDGKYGKDEVPEGSSVTAVQDANGEWIQVSGNAETIIEGKFGTLVVKADGSYTYTVNEDFRGYGEKDVFIYQVTSPSGEVSESELSFELNITPKEERIEIDNSVVVESEPTITHDGKSSIKEAVGFSVLDLALLGPIVDAKLLSGMNTLDFTVGENEIKELTMHGSAGGVAVGVGYDLFIYKLDPETGNYNQVHLEKDWFWAVLLGGKSDPLTLQFGEGTY